LVVGLAVLKLLIPIAETSMIESVLLGFVKFERTSLDALMVAAMAC
jgi:hypothetical protein